MKNLFCNYQAPALSSARRILLIMKLSGVLLLVGLLQVSATGLSQNSRINLDLENVPMEKFIAFSRMAVFPKIIPS